MKEKNNKGITLIALIVTVVLLLILASVSVTVAQKGGLYGTAKESTNRTRIQMDQKELLSAIVKVIEKDGKVNFTKLDDNLPVGFTGNNGTYISQAGNEYIVDEFGNVTLKGE